MVSFLSDQRVDIKRFISQAFAHLASVPFGNSGEKL